MHDADELNNWESGSWAVFGKTHAVPRTMRKYNLLNNTNINNVNINTNINTNNTNINTNININSSNNNYTSNSLFAKVKPMSPQLEKDLQNVTKIIEKIINEKYFKNRKVPWRASYTLGNRYENGEQVCV